MAGWQATVPTGPGIYVPSYLIIRGGPQHTQLALLSPAEPHDPSACITHSVFPVAFFLSPIRTSI